MSTPLFARAGSKVIDGKRKDTTVVSSMKKVISDIVRAEEILFMNHPSKNMFFNSFLFMLGKNIITLLS